MTMTQCRKQETVPATPSANTIKMTVTAGPGAKTNITDDGAITWTSGDKLYVSDGTKWLGSLTLDGEGGSASGTFTGTIQDIGEGTTTCHFFYLGHYNGMVEPTGTTDVSISFASQDGSREGALKYHLGHGSADVMVSGGVATGAVAMRTEIAIAHLKLKMDSKPYTGSVTMDVSNKMTVSPAGDFSGSGNGITIAAGTSGDRYVTLIPTTGTESVDVSFSGSSAAGSMTFGHGIQANNLYGMAAGIEVTVHEYVDLGLSVKWATCNVGADKPEGYGSYFAWGETETKSTYNWSTYKWCNGDWNKLTKYNTDSYYGTVDNKTVLDPEDDAARVNWGGDWRMPTEEEFKELIDNTNKTWTTVNGVAGWKCANKSDASDYIFLPAAGYRYETSLDHAGSIGDYWSSSLSSNPSYGRRLYFNSNDFSMYDSNRYDGYTVRPVRVAR